jgi:hypothetical protein
MFRTKAEQMSGSEPALPVEVLRLPEEPARVDALLAYTPTANKHNIFMEIDYQSCSAMSSNIFYTAQLQP